MAVSPCPTEPDYVIGGSTFSDNSLNFHGKGCMKTCSYCGRPIDEVDPDPENPAEVLGDLFHESVSPVDDSDICPSCKEDLGMRSLMGFGE